MANNDAKPEELQNTDQNYRQPTLEKPEVNNKTILVKQKQA